MEKIYGSAAYCEWLREQARLKRPYWYGVCHQACTAALLKRKTAQYPAHYAESRMDQYRADIAAGQIAGDCVGAAIKGAAWTLLGTEPWKYQAHGVPDRSADGMYAWCVALGAAHGPMATMPDRPGLAVRMKQHVGVYVGGGEVVEWRGFAYGCVVTKLNARPWLEWYELPWVEYAAQDEQPQNTRRVLREGCEGEDVKALQERLAELGYGHYLGRWGADGDFGLATHSAVMAFQDQHGLAVDGIVGPLTWAALDAAQPPAPEPTYTVVLRGLAREEMEAMKTRWPDAEVVQE